VSLFLRVRCSHGAVRRLWDLGRVHLTGHRPVVTGESDIAFLFLLWWGAHCLPWIFVEINLIQFPRWLLIIKSSDVEVRENLAANNLRPERSQH